MRRRFLALELSSLRMLRMLVRAGAIALLIGSCSAFAESDRSTDSSQPAAPASPRQSAPTVQPASGEGAAVCLACHENPRIMEIVDTPHANFKDPRSPASKEQCESCHGPSGTHVNFPMQVGNIRFTKHGKTPIAERNATCLACHAKGAVSHWDESAHAKKLQCGSCHTIHKRKQPSPVRADASKRCATCHPAILSTAPVTSPHPLVGEHAMTCSQCHNPHEAKNLTACLDCHPQNAQTLVRQSPKAQEYHVRALSEKIDCTACHKGFVHALPQITQSAPRAHP